MEPRVHCVRDVNLVTSILQIGASMYEPHIYLASFFLCFLLFHFSFLVNFQDIKLWKLISFATEFAKSRHFKSG